MNAGHRSSIPPQFLETFQLDLTKLDKRFGLNDPIHLLAKLVYNGQRISDTQPGEDLNRTFDVMDFMVFAWHMHDWIWEYGGAEGQARLRAMFKCEMKNAHDFGRALCERFTILKLAKFVANELKHFRLDKDDPSVKAWVEIVADDTGSPQWMPKFHDGQREWTDLDAATRIMATWLAVLAGAGFLPDALAERYKTDYWG